MFAFMEMNQLTKYVCYKGFIIVLGRLPEYVTLYRTITGISMSELQLIYVLQVFNALPLLT